MQHHRHPPPTPVELRRTDPFQPHQGIGDPQPVPFRPQDVPPVVQEQPVPDDHQHRGSPEPLPCRGARLQTRLQTGRGVAFRQDPGQHFGWGARGGAGPCEAGEFPLPTLQSEVAQCRDRRRRATGEVGSLPAHSIRAPLGGKPVQPAGHPPRGHRGDEAVETDSRQEDGSHRPSVATAREAEPRGEEGERQEDRQEGRRRRRGEGENPLRREDRRPEPPSGHQSGQQDHGRHRHADPSPTGHASRAPGRCRPGARKEQDQHGLDPRVHPQLGPAGPAQRHEPPRTRLHGGDRLVSGPRYATGKRRGICGRGSGRHGRAVGIVPGWGRDGIPGARRFTRRRRRE